MRKRMKSAEKLSLHLNKFYGRTQQRKSAFFHINSVVGWLALISNDSLDVCVCVCESTCPFFCFGLVCRRPTPPTQHGRLFIHSRYRLFAC